MYRGMAYCIMHCSSPEVSKHPPDVILHRSFTRPTTVLAVLKAWERGYISLLWAGVGSHASLV